MDKLKSPATKQRASPGNLSEAPQFFFKARLEQSRSSYVESDVSRGAARD
jgi:hypothetical protein